MAVASIDDIPGLHILNISSLPQISNVIRAPTRARGSTRGFGNTNGNRRVQSGAMSVYGLVRRV